MDRRFLSGITKNKSSRETGKAPHLVRPCDSRQTFAKRCSSYVISVSSNAALPPLLNYQVHVMYPAIPLPRIDPPP